MSQGSAGDWAPVDATPEPPTPPNPFVHELHLSRLQRVKVRRGQGASGGLEGRGRRGRLEPLPKDGVWGSGKGVVALLAQWAPKGAHVGVAEGVSRSPWRGTRWISS